MKLGELLGKVLWLIRHNLNISQQQVADYLFLPVSTVSKLELSLINAAVYHLDAFALAFTHFSQELRGESTPGWEGWELHRAATLIAQALEEDGYAVIWSAPEEVDEKGLYVTGRKLAALVQERWPEELRSRLGW